MIAELQPPDGQPIGSLRLTTLIRLRWLAIAGQSVAILVVVLLLGFPLPIGPCFALIAGSAAVNLLLASRYPASHRLEPGAAFGILMLDGLQLAGLLYMTGGLINPFAVLIIVPVIVSATFLPFRLTVLLGLVIIVCTCLLAFWHLPLPWYPGASLPIPFVYVAGMWTAIFSCLTFTAMYAWRVADEARQLAMALNATELVLQREQHLSALDGLAAAAAHELGTPLATISLVAGEMERALSEDSHFGEDVRLLRTQSERCRTILKQLTSLTTDGVDHLARMPLTSLIEEVVAPHRDFGISIRTEAGQCIGEEPIGRRNTGAVYGLGNIVENAVDFASAEVVVRWKWNSDQVAITVLDDGPGFSVDIIGRIGEPYTRQWRTHDRSGSGKGLGLGLFIAKTLLERSGARLRFRNSEKIGTGARVDVKWPRQAFETDRRMYADSG